MKKHYGGILAYLFHPFKAPALFCDKMVIVDYVVSACTY